MVVSQKNDISAAIRTTIKGAGYGTVGGILEGQREERCVISVR